MLTSASARGASGLALALILAGCSSSTAQTPAPLGATGSLGASSAGTGSFGQKTAQSVDRGFMKAVAPQETLLYMSTFGTAAIVDVLTTSGELVGQITNGLVEPEGLFVDSGGNLWVANFSNVLEYPHGALSPTTALSDAVGYPVDVSICPNGTTYVANFYNNSDSNVASIQVYPPGETSPTGNLTFQNDFRNPFVTCDAAGNVFAAILTGDSLGDGRVIEFPLGQQDGAKDLGITLQSPGGIKPDNAGNLLVTDLVANTISEYTESGSPTGKSIATGFPILGIALSRDGKTVLGANPNGPDGITWSFPGGKQKRVYTCCSRIGPPIQNNFGVAFYPGQKDI
jgi:hypothetical protein